MRFLGLPTALVGLLLLAACASRPPDAVHDELVAPYRLGSGDRIRVIVFGQPDLSTSFIIDQGGSISMPLIGTIPARGRTTVELEQAIASRLREGYLRTPDVSVEVERFRPFFAMGEVNAAGQYPYVAGMTVQSAVAIAGGFTPRADKRTVDVTRNFNGELVTAPLNLTDPVLPGDTVTVRQRIF